MITIWAKGVMKHMTVDGRPYSYREDVGQKSFYSGWKLEDAFAATKAEFPDAVQFVIGESGEGGCVTGWEKDAAPGY